MNGVRRINYALLLALLMSTPLIAQERDSIPDTQVEPPEPVYKADSTSSVNKKPFGQRIKVDGIAAVIGDYVILDSDIEKTLIDLRNQGASPEDITRCGLLGKLMEDRMYAHQAVQDSLLVSDDEVNATSDRQIQQLIQQVGSMEKVLDFYNKESVEDFRSELFEINKLQMLSQKMQQKIVSDIEVIPEEVRQFFSKIPEDERPVFGAELEISQIVKIPQIPEIEKQKAIDPANISFFGLDRIMLFSNGKSCLIKELLYVLHYTTFLISPCSLTYIISVS